jgi:hypothetical protein
LFAPTKPLTGAAGTAPKRYAVFRRPAGAADRLPSTKGLGVALEQDLQSYDPSLVREVAAQPLPAPFGTKIKYEGYMIVGNGAASELSLANYPCARRLAAQKRRAFARGLALERPFSPSGPAFCLVVVSRFKQHFLGPDIGGFCDTLADAATGYGSNEVGYGGESLTSIVPDGVATVVLDYRGHAPISARVTDNFYWTRVPTVPPLAQGPSLERPAVLRAYIRRTVPESIKWIGANGQVIRMFTPPAAYLRLVTARYRACVALNCGY